MKLQRTQTKYNTASQRKEIATRYIVGIDSDSRFQNLTAGDDFEMGKNERRSERIKFKNTLISRSRDILLDITEGKTDSRFIPYRLDNIINFLDKKGVAPMPKPYKWG